MAPNLAWGGFANGQIPRANLVDIGGGKLLQANAAESWIRFTQAFRARWGSPLYLADYQDAYRDLALQQYMWDHRNSGPPHPSKVAYPGNSIHGWARSVDCSGYGQRGSARHNWMVDNCARFNWSWDYGRSLNEPWHWDYVGPITTTAGDGGVVPFPPEPEPEPEPEPIPEEEDDMPKNAAIWYVNANNKAVMKIFNTGSGFESEYSSSDATPPGELNGQMARIFDMPVADWPKVSKEYAALLSQSLAAVRATGGGGSVTVEAPNYTAILKSDGVPGNITGTLTPQ